MTNEQLDRVWEAINRAIDDRFGKTLVVGIPIEERRDFAERVVREIGAIGIEPQASHPAIAGAALSSQRLPSGASRAAGAYVTFSNWPGIQVWRRRSATSKAARMRSGASST